MNIILKHNTSKFTKKCVDGSLKFIGQMGQTFYTKYKEEKEYVLYKTYYTTMNIIKT
jgi:hypothetical protein